MDKPITHPIMIALNFIMNDLPISLNTFVDLLDVAVAGLLMLVLVLGWVYDASKSLSDIAIDWFVGGPLEMEELLLLLFSVTFSSSLETSIVLMDLRGE
jgi:hypothetical protein